jgi:RNA 2',3'-cyclic 3'-phosphodiesterase
MKSIRAFIALKLPAAVGLSLGQTSQELAGQLSTTAVRWVKTEAMHLTLRFLDDTPVSALPEIATGLDQIGAGQAAFTLRLDKLGCFPNPRRPRVIWVGLAGDTEQMAALKQAVDNLLEPLGWEPEKGNFQPHLTLGRVKDHRAPITLPWGQPLTPLPLPVTAVHLIESQLRPSGPVYTTRHTSHLANVAF